MQQQKEDEGGKVKVFNEKVVEDEDEVEDEVSYGMT